MQTRTLGADLIVSAQGLGCMGMSRIYGPADEDDARDALRRALDLGVTLFDTADVYGGGHNEELLGSALRGRRAEVVLSTKFGFRADGDRRIDGRPDYVRAACDASLQRLGSDYIDIYYPHRLDPATPIEATVGAIADLIDDGKVRFIGLSEASAADIRRAHEIHPITAVQSEWSLWTRDPEVDDVLATTRELGIGFIAFSPLGRGFLSGELRSADDLAPGDLRRSNPRFQDENFARNLDLVDRVRQLALARHCTPHKSRWPGFSAAGTMWCRSPGANKPITWKPTFGPGTSSSMPPNWRGLITFLPLGRPRVSDTPERFVSSGQPPGNDHDADRRNPLGPTSGRVGFALTGRGGRTASRRSGGKSSRSNHRAVIRPARPPPSPPITGASRVSSSTWRRRPDFVACTS